MTSLPVDAPKPRLCRIRKRSPEEEYGFNLHAEKAKGQFIGTVDPDSPADYAGLLPGDRIISVNGTSVIGEPHKEVVRRIKENALSCDLIVADEDSLTWYNDQKIPIPTDVNFAEVVPAKSVTKEHPKPTEVVASEEHRRGSVESSNSSQAHVVVSTNAGPRPPSYSEAVGNVDSPTPFRARLCKLIKTDSTIEFGFNLHADRNKGHFIGNIDSNSIAERAGLEEGQRIVGVNGVLIYAYTPHKDVVSLIKGNPLHTELLVASPEVDEWHKNHGKEFDFSAAEHFVPIEPLEHEIVRRGVANVAISNGFSTNGESGYSNGNWNETSVTTETKIVDSEPKRAAENSHSQANDDYSTSYVHQPPPLPPIEPYESIRDTTPTHQRNPQQPEWMGMSAAQMRELVKQQKKQDPRQKQLTLEEKHELIRNM